MAWTFFHWCHRQLLLLTIILAILKSENADLSSAMERTGCSGACPPGTYESQPCTSTKDRECSACSVCRGSYYEASPCTPTTDRLCYHAALPLLLAGQQLSFSRFIEEFQEMKPKQKKHKRLKVEASANVFLEDLQNTRSLETTYYVTDMTQASDFYWDRESELRVNIGILNIHLIPEYHDVIHDGDNQYMLNSPSEVEDRIRFQQILQNNCRSPIPDYYSITLEVSRDRTTRAYSMTCDQADASKPRCPPPFKDGDVHLHRTLNEPCHKMATFPKELRPAANSIVCTEGSDLLSQIFNQSYAEEKFIRFPSPKCKNAEQQCNKCKNVHSCGKETYEIKLCLIDCLNLIDCKIALSEECRSTPIECAMGDAYQYTIQPVFHNIKTQFRCHVQRQSVPILYELFYFLQIPSIGFQTPKVHRTIYARDLSYQQHGKYRADFLTVEHTAGFELQKDFILAGQEVDERYNYTVSSATVTNRSRHIAVHGVSMTNHAFVVSAQFENPFDYSSSTWVNNNDCKKNISKLKPVHDGQPVDGQEVSVMVQNLAEPFQYFVKSVNSPPYIRFTVPGNTSVLPYYFRENGPVLYVNGSLSVILELTSAGRIWVIHVSGKMSGCPAYLGITISDRLEMEQLFRYDILIVCPAEFNLTFKVPNWGQQSHKTYDLSFQDPGKTYSVFATYFGSDRHLSVDPCSENHSVVVSRQSASGVVFLVVGATVTYFLLVAFLIQLCLHRKSSKIARESTGRLVLGVFKQPLTAKKLHRSASRRICLTAAYVIMRVMCCVFMSVTVLCLGVLFLVKHDLEVFSKIERLHAEKMTLVSNVTFKMEQEIRTEVARSQRYVEERQMSCSSYIGELMISIARLIKTVVYEKHMANIHGSKSSISYLIVNKTQEQLLRYVESADRFFRDYRAKLNAVLLPTYSDYRKYLSAIYQNEWFAFASDLFNVTWRDVSLPLHKYDNLTGSEVDFPIFLEIEEADESRMWFTQFLERYQSQHPAILPRFPEINITRKNLNCGAEVILDTAFRGPLHRYDSTHYFGPSDISDPRETKAENVIPSTERDIHLPRETQPVFRDFGLVEILSSGLFWTVCFVLDVLLLSHRVCRACCAARSLYVRLRHFAPRDCLVYQASSNSQPENGDCCHSQKDTQQQIQKSLQTLKINSQALANRYQKSNTANQACISDEREAPPVSRCQSVQFILSNAVRSNLVPHVIVASAIVASLSFLPKACLVLLNRKLHSSGSIAFDSSSLPLAVAPKNLSSLFVTDHMTDHMADHMTAQMRTYESQMYSELAILRTIVLLFNIEQKLMVESYVQELASLNPSISANGSNPEAKVPFQDLNVPLLPCNFILIEPKRHIEFTASKYERHLSMALQQLTTSISSITVTAIHCLLILMAVKLILHVIDSILLHCLRLHCGIRRNRSTHQSDDFDHCCTTSANSNIHGNEGGHSWQLTKGQCGARATSVTLVNASPTRVTAMLFDFGYSETKV